MADGDIKGVEDLDAELNAQVLADFGFFPEGTEIQNCGATGSGFQALQMVTPALELLRKEAEELPISREDWEKELVRETQLKTFEALLRELAPDSGRVDLLQMGLNVALWMWELQIPPLDGMTYEQIGALCGQTRAAIGERVKRKLQKKKEDVGQVGVRSVRQKPAGVIEKYSNSAKGNRNRAMAAAADRGAAALGRSKRG